MIYLRSINDDRGDTVDLAWFCSHSCYAASLASEPPSETFEQGGAYPCGAEHDLPDYCAHCGAVVGNPLTDAGAAYVVEYVTDVLSLDGFDTRGREEDIVRARELFREYRYAFENVELPASIY